MVLVLPPEGRGLSGVLGEAVFPAHRYVFLFITSVKTQTLSLVKIGRWWSGSSL